MTRSISARIGKLREALGSDRDEALALRDNGAIRKHNPSRGSIRLTQSMTVAQAEAFLILAEAPRLGRRPTCRSPV